MTCPKCDGKGFVVEAKVYEASDNKSKHANYHDLKYGTRWASVKCITCGGKGYLPDAM